MADITMCQDKECTLAATCYRFTATPNEWRQSYFMYSPRDGGACNQYVFSEKKEQANDNS
jgi:hypothetical protein